MRVRVMADFRVSLQKHNLPTHQPVIERQREEKAQKLDPEKILGFSHTRPCSHPFVLAQRFPHPFEPSNTKGIFFLSLSSPLEALCSDPIRLGAQAEGKMPV